MKFLTILLLVIAVNCSAQFKGSIATTSEYYRLKICPYGKTTPVAYLNKDSVLFVSDSLETINALIRMSFQTSEQIKQLIAENEKLRAAIKQTKEYQSIFAGRPKDTAVRIAVNFQQTKSGEWDMWLSKSNIAHIVVFSVDRRCIASKDEGKDWNSYDMNEALKFFLSQFEQRAEAFLSLNR